MTLIMCYHSGPEWTWEQRQWRGSPHSPKLQHCLNLTIRLFSVISRTLVRGGVLPLCRGAVSVFYSPSWLGNCVVVFSGRNVRLWSLFPDKRVGSFWNVLKKMVVECSDLFNPDIFLSISLYGETQVPWVCISLKC